MNNFQRIPIPFSNKNVRQVIEDKEGRIFLNTLSHIYLYNPENGEADRSFAIPEPQRYVNLKCHIGPLTNLWSEYNRIAGKYRN